MKKLIALIGPIFLTVFATLIWGMPGAFFTMSFSTLVVTLFRNAQII